MERTIGLPHRFSERICSFGNSELDADQERKVAFAPLRFVVALSGNNPIGLLSSIGSSITWFHLNHIRRLDCGAGSAGKGTKRRQFRMRCERRVLQNGIRPSTVNIECLCSRSAC